MNIPFHSVKQLESQIVVASTAYYEGIAIMTDEEFDCMIKALKDCNPNSSILKTGWGYVPKDRIVEHIGSEVGSLDKIQIANYIDRKTVIATPKYDGLTAVVYFEDGKYAKGVTRGDGKLGQDISSKLKWIIENTTEANLDDIVFDGTSIRGEVVVPLVYESDVLSLGYSNTRNFAAGVMNTKEDDYELLRYLHFVPYTIRDSKLSKWQCYEFFYEKNLITPCQVGLIENILDSESLRLVYNKWREIYPIDGIVLTKEFSEDIDNDSYAVKFETEEKPAVVDTVEWSTRSTGAVIPVVILKEPIKIHGANIQRLSGYNWKYITDNKIGHDAEIIITRANEVIPKILNVTKPSSTVVWPHECPVCGSPTSVQSVHLICENPLCPSVQINQVHAFLTRCDIDKGIGQTTWDKYFEHFSVGNFFDFVNSVRNYDGNIQHLEFLGDSMSKKVAQAITVIGNKIKNITYEDILVSMNIPGLGTTHAKTLGQYTFQELKDKSISENNNLGTNVTVGREISNRIDDLIMLVNILWPTNPPTITVPINITGIEVCITGKLEYGTRDKFAKAIESYGFISVDGVNKNTKYLICNSTSSSSKSKTASKLGVPVISEQAFLDHFNIVL